MCTDSIQRALSQKNLAPKEHLADAGYISAELLIRSQAEYGIELIGPSHENPTWQSKVVGAYTSDQFQIDWEQRVVHCPQGISSTRWRDYVDAHGKPYHLIGFPKPTCQACSQRALCTKAKHQPRRLYLHPRPQQEALQTARALLQSTEGYQRYAPRAGVEGTLSQGVRAFGLRRSRYQGLAKTHLQHIVIAAAIRACLKSDPHGSFRPFSGEET